MPNLTRVQVIHVEDESALGLIADYAPSVDRFLLDSGRTKGAAAQFGGTGTVHDWSISKRFVASTDRPVFLAGGLNSKNVFKAITEVRPYGVDVCSGVRSALGHGSARQYHQQHHGGPSSTTYNVDTGVLQLDLVHTSDDGAAAGALAVAEQRFGDAASGVASVWMAAWEKAGKPKLVDTPRGPSRIRR